MSDGTESPDLPTMVDPETSLEVQRRTARANTASVRRLRCTSDVGLHLTRSPTPSQKPKSPPRAGTENVSKYLESSAELVVDLRNSEE